MTSGGHIARRADIKRGHQKAAAMEVLEARTLLDALPDLTTAVDQVSMAAVVLPGDAGQATVLVTNGGKVGAYGPTTVQVRLAGEPNVVLGQASINLDLAPGASQEFAVHLVIPPWALAGDYALQSIVDPQDTIIETNEGNNVSDPAGAMSVEWRFGTFDDRKNFKLRVLDDNGNLVTFSLAGPGNGEVQGGASFDRVVLDETTAKTTMTIAAADSSVGTIVSSGPLKAIQAKGIDLCGGADLQGGVKSITFDDTRGDQTIVIGAFSNPKMKTSFNFHQIYNLSITSEMAIKSIKAAEWLDSGGVVDSVTAPRIDGLRITGDAAIGIVGDFEASLNVGNVSGELDASNSVVAVARPLKSVKVNGGVENSTWQVTGSAGPITIKGKADHWQLSASDDVKFVKVAAGNDSTVSAGDRLGGMTTMQWTDGRLQADRIGTIKCTGNAKAGIAGDLTGDVQADNIRKLLVAGSVSGAWDANAIHDVIIGGAMSDMIMRLGQGTYPELVALRKLRVAGAITNASVLSAGSIDKVSSAGISTSTIYAGVDSQAVFADANGDGVADLLAPQAFAAGAAIRHVNFSRMAGQAYSVSNTSIGADRVGIVTLGDIDAQNAGTPFGISGRTFKHVTFTDSGQRFTWPSGSVTAPQDGDFVVRVM